MEQTTNELERIREWMASRQLRPVDVARGIGWGELYPYVSNMLSGSRPLSRGFRLKLVLAYPETADIFRQTVTEPVTVSEPAQ